MSKIDITERSFNFSVRVVKLCTFLAEKGGINYQLSKQLIRSGTSIGANVEEAQDSESRADFIHKLKIAVKEARETNYWLRLLIATDENLQQRLLPLLNESNELIAILVTIIKNTKTNS